MNYPDRIELVLTYKHDAEDAEIFTERVEAEKFGDYYKLVHIPAFAPNLAYGDIVKVEYDDGEFHFDELIKESGYSVMHIVVFNSESKDQLIFTLSQFGCVVNTHVADNYVVVSIPPALVYQPIRDYLINEESFENISFRECLSKGHAATI